MKNNKRTLKNRIRKFMFLCFLLASIFFTTIIMGLIGVLIIVDDNSMTKYLTLLTSRELSSSQFLTQMKLKDVIEFNIKNSSIQTWINDKEENNNSEKNDFLMVRFINIMNNSVIGLIREKQFYLKIDIDGKNVYRTDSLVPIQTNFSKLRNFYDNLLNKEQPIYDSAGKVAGSVSMTLNPDIIIDLLQYLAVIVIIFALVLCFIASFAIKLFAIPITTPLNQLEKKMRSLATGDEDIDFSKQIAIKRPLKEIDQLVQYTNMIMGKIKDYTDRLQNQNDKLETQYYELEAQNQELMESKKKIEETQGKLIISREAIGNLLDNAGQGFLSFGEDLIVNEEYSSECVDIFSKEIKGLNFVSLLYNENSEEKSFMENALSKIFRENLKGRKELYISLLPEEIELHQRNFRLEYKIIKDRKEEKAESIMVVLTDITEKKSLELQMAEEKSILRMVVNAVVNFKDLLECIRKFEEFYSTKMFSIVRRNNDTEQAIFHIFREIHTFKGNFSQLDMSKVVSKLHHMESKLERFQNDIEASSSEKLEEFLKNCHMEQFLVEDLRTIKEILGEDFISTETVVVDKSKILEIEKMTLKVLPWYESRILLPKIKELRYKPFKELVENYSEYIDRIAIKLNKTISPLKITGGDFNADVDKYYSFSRSLVNIFRNIVDHGIEDPEERIAKGKDEFGTVECIIEQFDNTIALTIVDDGRGLDIEAIREKAIEKGIYDRDAARKLTSEQISQIILEPGFSTKEIVTEYSGRGIGLSAVKHEIDNLGGTMEVRSIDGFGTEFYFTIPFENLICPKEVYANDIMNSVIQIGKDFLKYEIKEQLIEEKDKKILKVNSFSLMKYTSIISIRGLVNGRIIISVDEGLGRNIADKFMIEDICSEEYCEFIENALLECTNIIIGNSLRSVGNIKELISIGMPINLSSEKAKINYSGSNMWTYEMRFASGNMSISFGTTELMEDCRNSEG